MRFKYILLSLIIFFFLNVPMAHADICQPDPTSPNQLCNPSGTGDFQSFFKVNFFPAVVTILGIAAIIMVVYSGIRMISSQGDAEQISKAKSSLKWTSSGLLVVILAFAMVSAISQFFGAKIIPEPSQAQVGVTSPIASNNILTLSGTVFKGLAGLVAVLSMFFIIINGFRYMTAQGNDEQVENAQRGLQWAVIGLIIVLLGYVIVSATLKLFNSSL